METTRLAQLTPERRNALLRRANAAIFDPQTLGSAQRAVADVRARGDEALLDYTARWDRVALTREDLVVGPDEVAEACASLDESLRQALIVAIERARRYNTRLRPSGWIEPLESGIMAGVQFTPLDSVGVYVPSGKGRFPSSCVTIVTPAVVAGVPDIRVLVPPRSDGSADPAVLVACDLLGVRTIYRSNGVAGLAALAVGTETISPVPAVAGPGNPHIAAVQLVVQTIGVRTLALLGPTESIILADETADPRLLALDLLNEAEHGTDSAALLITTTEALADEVVRRLPELVAALPEERRRYAEGAIGFGGIFVADSMGEAVAFINEYAPEHLQLAVRDPDALLPRIRHAGEILLGQSTPFAAGNYALGVPAALPTTGAARHSSGITVLSFLKASSIARLDARALDAVRPVVQALGTYEGFPAHVMAVRER